MENTIINEDGEEYLVFTANSGIKAKFPISCFKLFRSYDFELFGKELERFNVVFRNLEEAGIFWNEGLDERETEETYKAFFQSCSYLQTFKVEE